MGVLNKDQFISKFLDDTDSSSLKLGGFTFSGEQVVDIIRSYQGGESLTSIGKRYNCSRDTISRRLRDWGFKA